jgi:retron-type reverse transcriptase
VVSFDNLDKGWLIKFVEHRVADPRILRLIQKWLNAGVLEEDRQSARVGDFADAREHLPVMHCNA